MSTNRHLMGRRQFLIASSACALATASIGPKLFAGEAGAAPRRLAVGFAAFDETARVMPAAAIPAGDGAFIGRGARILVSGASGVSGDPIHRRAVELVAHYPYFEGSERRLAPFRAWGCSRTTGCEGSPANFTVPVDETQRIVFSVETERGNPSAAATRRDALTGSTPQIEALPVTLTLASGAGTLKLARGFYVIVPLFDDDGEPRWGSYELRQADGRWALHARDGKAAEFEHFVLRIDYAS
jgi:hypothetical protein